MNEPGYRRDILWALGVAVATSVGMLTAMTCGSRWPAHHFEWGSSLYGSSAHRRTSAYPWMHSAGQVYQQLAEDGYVHRSPHQPSNAAFFPGYAITAWFVSLSAGISIEWALLAVSVLCFWVAAALFPFYLQRVTWMTQQDCRRWIVLYCTWPIAIFFCSCHSEALFLLAVVAFLVCLFHGSSGSLWLAAFFAGLAGWTRVVGIALAVVLAYHLFVTRRSCGPRLQIKLVLVCLSLWGTAAAMEYQYLTLGDPLAFIHARPSHALRPLAPWWQRFVSMLALEPLWVPGWFYEGFASYYHTDCWFCRYSWMNPIVTYTFAVLFLVAFWKDLATTEELLLAGLLWAIPYFCQAHESYLLANARYNLFGFPAFHVIVYAVRHWPRWLFAALCASSLGLLLFFSYGMGAGCEMR